MSVTRTLGGPLLGTAAAGLVLYSVGHSLALRTHQVTDALHSSSRNLRRLADVDDTQDLLKQLHVAPEAPLLASKLDHTKHEAVGSALPAAYQRPVSPSLTEQVKARWNEHLITLTHVMAETDLDKIVSSLSSAASTVYAKATGQPLPARVSSDQPSFISSLRALSPSPEQAATLRETLTARHDPRLDASNTHYLGQGTSLR